MTALSSALSLVLFVLLYPSKSNKYILVTQEMNGNNASSYCQTTYGTHLASIHDWNDNWEASNLCQIKPFCLSNTCKMVEMGCYIGLNDRQNERLGDRTDWVWDDGTAYDYSNWRGGEPTDGIYEADCVIIYPDTHPSVSYVALWADVYCTTPSDLLYDNKMYFLCNMPPTMDPTSLPTNDPTLDPTINPTVEATKNPTQSPTFLPTMSPTFVPTDDPTNNPTFVPTNNPTKHPLTLNPTTFNPTQFPSIRPSVRLNEEQVKDNVYTTIGQNDDDLSDRKKPASIYDDEESENMNVAPIVVHALFILLTLIVIMLVLIVLVCYYRKKVILVQNTRRMTTEVKDTNANVNNLYIPKQEQDIELPQNVVKVHEMRDINIVQNMNHMMAEAEDMKEQREKVNSMRVYADNQSNEDSDDSMYDNYQNDIDYKTISGMLAYLVKSDNVDEVHGINEPKRDIAPVIIEEGEESVIDKDDDEMQITREGSEEIDDNDVMLQDNEHGVTTKDCDINEPQNIPKDEFLIQSDDEIEFEHTKY